MLQHCIRDFWTAKTLHTFLNVVSKKGGVLYIRQCFCFCTVISATEHQKGNIFVLERTRTQRTEKPAMLICCSCGSNSREEVSMEWTGDRSSRWPAARKAFSSWRLSKWRWQVWCHSFNGVAGKWRFPRAVKQHIKQHYLDVENKIRWRWPWWWGNHVSNTDWGCYTFENWRKPLTQCSTSALLYSFIFHLHI